MHTCAVCVPNNFKSMLNQKKSLLKSESEMRLTGTNHVFDVPISGNCIVLWRTKNGIYMSLKLVSFLFIAKELIIEQLKVSVNMHQRLKV